MTEEPIEKLHPSLWDSFVELPPDPETPLTSEQLQALFPHPETWCDVVELTMQKHAIEPETNANEITSASA